MHRLIRYERSSLGYNRNKGWPERLTTSLAAANPGTTVRARAKPTSSRASTPKATSSAKPRPVAPATKAEVRVFVSYSHADAGVQARLETHLAVLKRDGVTTWFDGDMLTGDALDREIARALRQAHIFVALVSSDYLNSRYCQLEYRRAMGRRAKGLMRVAAVVVRPCDWKAASMAAFKLLPHDGRAVSDFRRADTALVGVVQALRALVKAVRSEAVRQAPVKSSKPRSPARQQTGRKPGSSKATGGNPAKGGRPSAKSRTSKSRSPTRPV